MSEPIEVRVARLEENMKFLVDNAKLDRESRKTQYEALEGVTRNVAAMVTQISAIDAKLAGQAPTIEEFITIKHKVVGAGKLGRWIWVFGAALIGYIFAMREAIGAWLIKV